MKKLLGLIAGLSLLFASIATAQTINNLGAGRGSVAGSDLFPSYQGANPAVRPSAAQIAAYVYGLMNGACTAGGTGTITCSGVTSVAAGCGTSTGGSPITTTGTVSSAVTLRSNTAASDTIVSTDCGNLVYENRATAVAASIAQAGTAGFAAGAFFQACNINAGAVTITPTTSTIGGASTYVIPAGTAAAPSCIGFQSDGTNYNLITGTLGTNTLTIASGTSALGTGAIASATCATVVTTAGTGIATTDTVTGSFNGDPTAVTGYSPSASGMLTIIGYPTSGNVNWKVCNNTSGSITPGAITLNWRVVR